MVRAWRDAATARPLTWIVTVGVAALLLAAPGALEGRAAIGGAALLVILQMKLGRVDSGYFKKKFNVDVTQRYAEAFARLQRRSMLDLHESGATLTRKGLLAGLNAARRALDEGPGRGNRLRATRCGL